MSNFEFKSYTVGLQRRNYKGRPVCGHNLSKLSGGTVLLTAASYGDLPDDDDVDRAVRLLAMVGWR